MMAEKQECPAGCSCHPDDRPPVCQKEHATTHCKLAYAETQLSGAREIIKGLSDRLSGIERDTHYGIHDGDFCVPFNSEGQPCTCTCALCRARAFLAMEEGTVMGEKLKHAVVKCCVIGLPAGHPNACNDCDPCLMHNRPKQLEALYQDWERMYWEILKFQRGEL